MFYAVFYVWLLGFLPRSSWMAYWDFFIYNAFKNHWIFLCWWADHYPLAILSLYWNSLETFVLSVHWCLPFPWAGEFLSIIYFNMFSGLSFFLFESHSLCSPGWPRAHLSISVSLTVIVLCVAIFCLLSFKTIVCFKFCIHSVCVEHVHMNVVSYCGQDSVLDHLTLVL